MKLLGHLGLLLLTATLAFAAGTPGTYAVLANGFSIRHISRETIGDMTRLYVADKSYVDVPTSDIVRYEQEEIAPPVWDRPPSAGQSQRSGVTADLSALTQSAERFHAIDRDFLAAVIRAESSGNPHAVSPKGAQGLMQLMPQTASKLGVANPFDPAANVDGGAQYLRQLLDQYHGDAVRALAAYNAGPQRVQQYGGVPPYRETRAYVARIIRDYNRRKLAENPALAATTTKKSKRAK